ncbi:DUF397 domain-containing protein [Glycomyces terrestris]|uniref:DUF397 domain-containing protein n=1 Tax=Glycomyces terrestris TaxID=2493553 RepID=A0A426V5E2_9ACTN|nr:DUF397 domain-containing protein [Glycomyces terrestris]RRS02124.1 DUF397 domain-containing protein [Glycomyces terrestris]
MQNVTAWRKSTRSNGSGTSSCVELRRSWRKSSHSGGDGNSDCVELRRNWRKSARSNGSGTSECVELCACTDDGFHIRDSKLGDDSPVFGLASADLTALLSAAS